MKTAEKKLYEGMFLVDANEAAADWDGVVGAIKTVLERSEAEIVSREKWDDRRLAYEINKSERGCYILSYFKVEGPKLSTIERDIRLSDQIIRALILSAEPIPQEVIEADTPVAREQKARQQAAARQQQAQAEAEAEAEEQQESQQQPQETDQQSEEPADQEESKEEPQEESPEQNKEQE